jgi:hypothetical protein
MPVNIGAFITEAIFTPPTNTLLQSKIKNKYKPFRKKIKPIENLFKEEQTTAIIFCNKQTFSAI